MKKALMIIMILLLATAAAAYNEGFGIMKMQENRLSSYVPDELIVKMGEGADPASILPGASVKSDNGRIKVVRLPKGISVAAAMRAYKGNPAVEYAAPNMIVRADSIPDDPYYSPYQWHLDNPVYGGINAEEAWDVSTGAGVVVAVLDTGVSQSLQDSVACFVAGYDFINDDADPDDDNGHGSHVAGTVAQKTNNGIGVAGVAYDACIMPVKVLDAAGSGSYDALIDGIYFAADNGADIITMSLSAPSIPFDCLNPALEDALEYAKSKGIVITAAAGNTGSNTYNCPAAYDSSVIAVGATGYTEDLAPYSTYYRSTRDPVVKRYVDLTAPGGDMRYDLNDDGYPDGVLQNTIIDGDEGYYFFEGTSMATPHVAGAAALVISKLRSEGAAYDASSVRKTLETTAEDHGKDGWDMYYGWGIVDAAAALGTSEEPPAPPAPSECVISSGCDCNGRCHPKKESLDTCPWDCS